VVSKHEGEEKWEHNQTNKKKNTNTKNHT